MQNNNLSSDTTVILLAIEAWFRNNVDGKLDNKKIGIILYFTNLFSPLFNIKYPFPYQINLKNESFIFSNIKEHIDILIKEKLIEKNNNSYSITQAGIQKVRYLTENKEYKEYYDIAIITREITSFFSTVENDYINFIFKNDYFLEQGLTSFENYGNAYNINNISKIVLEFYPSDRCPTSKESIHRYLTYIHFLCIKFSYIKK